MSDPTFARRPKKHKVKLDARFASALSDPKFGVAEAPVDKYGRPTRRKDPRKELRPFYELDEAETVQERFVDEADDEDSSSDLSEPEAWDEGLPATHELGNCDTKRLAATDMDWGKVRAEDLLMIFKSLCPPGGSVDKVQVFMSEYGKREIEKEDVRGPSIEDFRDGFDPEALRRYELQKQRRYFAIIIFDTVATASAVYKNDGLDLDSASLSLAFVPDGLTFSNLRDEAVDVTNYEPQKYTLGQHTAVKCTWDDDEPQRRRAFDKAFEDHEAFEYLASDDSDTGENLRASLGLDDAPLVESGDGDDEGTEVPVERRKRAKRKVVPEEDDEGYDVRKLEKVERLKNKKLRGKRKRQRDALNEEMKQDGFNFDAADSRFGAVLDGANFAIDPAAPDFKRTTAMTQLLNEQSKRRTKKRAALAKIRRNRR